MYSLSQIQKRAAELEKSEYNCMRSSEFPTVSLKYTGTAEGIGSRGNGMVFGRSELVIIRPLILPGQAKYVFFKTVAPQKAPA